MCHSAAASSPPSSGLSPVFSSPPGSPWVGWSLGCSGPGLPPLRLGSDGPGPPLPPPPGSRGDGGTVPALLGDERAQWCAGAAGTLLWTGRWQIRTEGAPCRTNTGGSGSSLSQQHSCQCWCGRGSGCIMRHQGPRHWHELVLGSRTLAFEEQNTQIYRKTHLTCVYISLKSHYKL